jgi:peptidoglycan-N-acetylglucosamine deacetylase
MKPLLKPISSLSLDLDNQWSYMKTHGDGGWSSFPSYLDTLVPRVLNFLKERNLTITVFVVGQDAALDNNQEALRSIADAGHEIGNHSFHHEPWLHLYSAQQIEEEIATAEEHIERATGQKPVGFRGPGYSLSQATVKELIRRQYLYDATTFPTFLMPIVRLYYFATATLTDEQKRQRRQLGGRLRDGLRPNRPYWWNIDGKSLFEIPVTTLPGVKLPMHMSYLLTLRQLSSKLAIKYFATGLRLCRLMNLEPSIVLHPTDFLGIDDGKGLSFIPGMGLPHGEKLEFVNEVLNTLQAAFSVVTLREHATRAARGKLTVMRSAFLPEIRS